MALAELAAIESLDDALSLAQEGLASCLRVLDDAETWGLGELRAAAYGEAYAYARIIAAIRGQEYDGELSNWL